MTERSETNNPELNFGASPGSARGEPEMAISDVPHEVLLPCPCCGEAAFVAQVNEVDHANKPLRYYKVTCYDCDLQTNGSPDAKCEAETWNRRAGQVADASECGSGE